MKQFRGREHKIVSGIRKKYGVDLEKVDQTLLDTLAGGSGSNESDPVRSNRREESRKSTHAAATPNLADRQQPPQRRTSTAQHPPSTSPKVKAAARKSASRHNLLEGLPDNFNALEIGEPSASPAPQQKLPQPQSQAPAVSGTLSRHGSRSSITSRRPPADGKPEITGPVTRTAPVDNHTPHHKPLSRRQSKTTITITPKTKTKTSAEPTSGGGAAPESASSGKKADAAAGTTSGKKEKPHVKFKPELKNRAKIKVKGYKELRYIGKGKFATAYRAIRVADGEPVALKHIHGYANLKDKQKRRQHQEIRFLQKLEHPNIVHYFDSFKHEGSLIIVCEWAAAGDLKRQIQKIVAKGKYLSELNIWKYFHQITSAVQYMHEHRILHRDLKPANILLTAKGQIKVTDFGLSRGMSDGTAVIYSKVGTPLYMAPEVIIGKGYGYVVMLFVWKFLGSTAFL